ncbi:MAG: SpoIIE family protein phosphatase [Deltaproteobacteria bacterium]|nr:SpoIIE family protein phosphatase [Deltaproteobacteria bacterium]
MRDAVRYVSCEKVFGAAVRTGGEKTLHGRKNGDSVLVDLQNNFVAVADGPERNPSASQSFLKRIHGMLGSAKPHAEIGDLSVNDVEKRFHGIIGETNSIVKTVRYTDNTTFTALFFVRHVRKALLLHTGDSMLYHFRIDEDTAEKVSQTNHCFVGRIDRLYQTKLIDYVPDSRFLLATDGFYDLVRDMRNSTSGKMEKELLALLKTTSVDQLPRELIRTYDVKPEMSDDLGIVVLNPDYDDIPNKAYYLL